MPQADSDSLVGASHEERRTAMRDAQEALRTFVDNEPVAHPLVVMLVAPLGTPLDGVVDVLKASLERFAYVAHEVRLSDLLEENPYQPWGQLPRRGDRDYYQLRMDAGDQLRRDTASGAALAALAVAKISDLRTVDDADRVVYVLRSAKHPEEVRLLRHVYGDAFSLVAVSSSAEERRENLAEKLAHFESPLGEAERLIARDESDGLQIKYGQRVRDVYQVADVFVQAGRGLEVAHEIDRFVDCLFGAPFSSPTREEEGMKQAKDASLRSASMGRQVGAALMPRLGTPLTVGTNEVPRPGGGQYWGGDVPDHRDFQTGADPNPLYTKRVIQELLERLRSNGWLIAEYGALSGAQLLARAQETNEQGDSLLTGARASSLIEFTRCLHAEQAAIVNAARTGVATEGAVLFSTTFPCHECAKLIVGAGIVTVYYIEPYPKSLVGRLYRDLIDVSPSSVDQRGLVGGKVPFRAFEGIAPRRYEAAFTAGERRLGAEAAVFQRTGAVPRAGGWSKLGVQEREAGVVASITRMLAALKGEGRKPVGDAETGQLTRRSRLDDQDVTVDKTAPEAGDRGRVSDSSRPASPDADSA